MWSPGKIIPTNLITGFLGTGKTTAIGSLLQARPQGQRWSILINEYGLVSIDHALLDSSEPLVQVEELSGGCFCCSLSIALPGMLTRFIHHTKPDRLFVELTGAGHPAGVIDLLRSERFSDVIDLRTTICLVNPRDCDDQSITSSAAFEDQIQLSDVVAINFTDVSSPVMIEVAERKVGECDPPKLLVVRTQHGIIDPAWLDLTGTVFRTPLHCQAHTITEPHRPSDRADGVSERGLSITSSPQPGLPRRHESEGLGVVSCGWVFSSKDSFDRDQLLDLLGGLLWIDQPAGAIRLKGVFHCGQQWLSINRSTNQTSVQSTTYRRDSRIEVILLGSRPDWKSFESRLLGCLQQE